jgi:WD40 repeat protein
MPVTRRLGLLLLFASFVVACGQLARGEPPVGQAKQEPAPSRKRIHTDLYGDPLPDGAVARLGTVRLRPGNEVFSVIFTPDGKSLIFPDSGSASDAGRFFIGIYDPATGARVRGFSGHRLGSEVLALSPDGKTLAGIGGAHSVCLWDMAGGRLLHEFGASKGNLVGLAFSPDGKTLATIGCGTGIQLWDTATGKRARRLAGEAYGWVVAYSPDGRFLAAGGREALQLWDVAAGKLVWQVKGGEDGTHALAFSPDGKILAAGDRAGSVRLVEPAGGKEIRHWAPHSEGEKSDHGTAALAFSPDGKTLASGGSDGMIYFWDPLTGKKRRALRGHFSAIYSLAFSPDGGALASGGHDHTVRLWDVATGRARPALDGHRCLIDSVAFSPDGKVLASRGYDDNEIRLWDPESGKPLRFLEDCHSSVTYSPDGKSLASSNSDGVMRLRDVATGRVVRSLEGRLDNREAAAFHPDGRILASAGPGPLIRLWDTTTGKEQSRLSTERKPERIGAVAFSPDGKLLVCTEEMKTIHLWDWTRRREVRRLAGSEATIYCVAFAPDGRALASAGEPGLIRFWGVKDGEERVRWKSHHRSVEAIAFSPDGRVLATAGRYDGFIALWEVLTGQELCRLDGHREGIDALAFSPDGRQLASGSRDFTVLVWDIPAALGKDVVPPADLEPCWKALASDDARAANRAVWQLAKLPARSVPMLSERMRRVPRVDVGRINRLIADLDDDDFGVRTRATAALQSLGDVAEASLRKAYRAPPSEEVRRRVEELLTKLAAPVPPAGQLRLLRALAVLEEVGTPEARRLLESLADGEPDARLTQEARTVLERLARQAARR